ncbi:hypothetical protein NLG97_g6727 [Lecanicillium saksenae]|uniref:Uncharacterized protein n=1 Tax=Lecanicillium saksenae TaxID=468837 RepID=A0ACC1QRE3_9HYPO|nr:hypothetical protein NLG97_g6727 [Lecanicillium saksenae]
MSEVEYTISQDEADGRSARHEANYPLLTANDVEHTTESIHGKTYAYTDYKLQLMLLEQQKKKRLLMEQQQASRDGTLNQFHDEPEPVDASLEDIHGTSLLPTSVPSSGRRSQESAVRGTDSSDQSLSAASKNRRVQAPQESLANVQRHQSLEVNPTRGNISMEEGSGCLIAGPASPIAECNPSSPRYIILSRVICASHHKQCDQRIYRDVPYPVTFNGVYHIAGSSLVTDLVGLLEIQEDTLFIVYRDYHCDRTSSTSIPKLAKRQQTRYQREILSVVAEELQLAIQSISKFAPDYGSYNRDRDEEFSDPTSLSTFTKSPYEYSRKYLYHHRTEIHDKASAGPEDDPIVVLSQWLAANPDPMYDECDRLFSQGLISKSTLQWLFIPNSIVVSHERSTAIAYVLEDLITEESGLHLGCWSWAYDGNGLVRQPTGLTVGMATYAVVNITQLDVYPIKYAVRETKNAILKTGKQLARAASYAELRELHFKIHENRSDWQLVRNDIELNGRQIRNALTTARQLALYEGEILNWERLKTALEVNMHFQTYLRDVHGHTAEEWNRENRLR